MSWQIAKRQLLLNVLTFRFAVATAVCVLLVVVLVPLLIGDYSASLEDYAEAVAHNSDELRKVKVYKNIKPTVHRPPTALSVLSRGVESQLDASAKVELGSVPTVDFASADVNPFLSIFPGLDVSQIFVAVLSMLALLLAYDVISGERERGTLKLMLSGPLPRSGILLGKLASGLLTLLIPVTIAFVITGLMLELSSRVRLTGEDWLRVGLMYVVSMVFCFSMHNMALFFSCVTRRSGVSLMLALFAWVCFVGIIPNASTYAATRLRALDSKDKTESQVHAVWDEFQREVRAHEYERSGGAEADAQGAFGLWYAALCDENYMRYGQERHSFEEPLRIMYAERAAQVRRGYFRSLIGQKRLADNLSRLSLVPPYQRIMCALARTDVESVEFFFEGAAAQRREVADYIRARTERFSATSYFTPCDDKTRKAFEELLAKMNSGDGSQGTYPILELYERIIAETPPLDLDDLPALTARHESAAQVIRRVLPDLTLLLLACVLFSVMSLAAFARYDAR